MNKRDTSINERPSSVVFGLNFIESAKNETEISGVYDPKRQLWLDDAVLDQVRGGAAFGELKGLLEEIQPSGRNFRQGADKSWISTNTGGGKDRDTYSD